MFGLTNHTIGKDRIYDIICSTETSAMICFYTIDAYSWLLDTIAAICWVPSTTKRFGDGFLGWQLRFAERCSPELSEFFCGSLRKT